MTHLSIFCFSLCSLAILTESIPSGSLTTTEILRSNEYDARNVIEKPHADILKRNDPQGSLVNQSHLKSAARIGEQSAASLYLNNKSDASTTPTVSSSDNSTKDVQYTKRIENRRNDASPSNHKDRSDVDLLSHDVLLNPFDVISPRLTRQNKKSDMDYSNPSSIKNSAELSIENENMGSSQKSSDESDLGVAEDRYRYQYPYWYRGQFANQRYRANNRREPYRNYLRYPVFPGK
ncbi:uncharacterized protein LOC126857679 [Cataglyphis hispanica]|uniref:uncharacterized protein LOC126857679 n=1 Tax=Cataglyphis hispanica TaxID=1086592 RepID=UPI00217F9F8A|nr:uncharacterized protein LOC126857679 [Cataglyphis hispanica]